MIAVITLAVIVLGLWLLMRGSARASQEQPPPSLPPQFWTPRQRLDTERLLMSPDQRAYEVDQLHALWAASPDEAEEPKR